MSFVQGHKFVGDIPLQSITRGAPPLVGSLPPPDLVVSNPGLGSLAHFRFYDPAYFRAGNIHSKLTAWQNLLRNLPCSDVDVLEIRDGFRIDHFFKLFKVTFKGRFCDSCFSSSIIIKNSPSFAKFSEFISDTVIQWVTMDVIAVWGPVESVVPPHFVLPLTVEPTESRLGHDERFLNLWIHYLPFKLDHLCDYPDMSGLTISGRPSMIRMSINMCCFIPSSQTYFGFEWHFWYSSVRVDGQRFHLS